MISDKIEPMGIDLTKNLHGHVRVETRDRWTGRVVDSQEKENLVTNAVAKVLQTNTWMASLMSNVFTPIFQKALGGIFLFDGTLTESASNIYFPSNVKLVASAGQGADSAGADRGSYNNAESVVTSTGFTTVWDFLTSQANGTIASLARTSYNYVAYPAFLPSLGADLAHGAFSTFSSIHHLGYDETNKYLYLSPATDTTIGNVTYTTSGIYRVSIDLEKIGLYNTLPPAAKMTLIKTLTSSDGSATASYYRYDKYDNNFIYATGSTLHIVAVDGTHTTKSISGSGTQQNITVTENYYWRNSTDTIYRISKANTTDIQEYTLGGNSWQLVPDENDIVFAYNKSVGYQYILYPDGTSNVQSSFVIGGSSNYAYDCRKIGLMYDLIGLTSLYANTHYLGTIANLDSPVTKTSSQTMKITYTLTEA